MDMNLVLAQEVVVGRAFEAQMTAPQKRSYKSTPDGSKSAAAHLSTIGQKLASIGLVLEPLPVDDAKWHGIHRASVLTTSHGVSVAILNGKVMVGYFWRCGKEFYIESAQIFNQASIFRIFECIRSLEKPTKKEVAQEFGQLVRRMQDLGIQGQYDEKDLSFTTAAGAVVEAMTVYRDQNGLWARITSKIGAVTVRDLRSPWYGPDHIYRNLVASFIRKHELVERGFMNDLRTKILDYGKCNHRNREVDHNCGCTEVVTIRQRK